MTFKPEAEPGSHKMYIIYFYLPRLTKCYLITVQNRSIQPSIKCPAQYHLPCNLNRVVNKPGLTIFFDHVCSADTMLRFSEQLPRALLPSQIKPQHGSSKLPREDERRRWTSCQAYL